MSLIVQLGTTVVPKAGSSTVTPPGSGGRNITYRDSRITTQPAQHASNSPGIPQTQVQHRTIMTAGGAIRGGQNSNNLTAGTLKIHSQHHRVLSTSQQAQVAIVQKTPSSANIHQKTNYVELQTRKVVVPVNNSRLSSESTTKEVSSEKPPVEEKKTTNQSLMYQYVLQEHNYVALPPATPPLSPLMHHSIGVKLNGAQSSGSPSSVSSDPHSQSVPHPSAPSQQQLQQNSQSHHQSQLHLPQASHHQQVHTSHHHQTKGSGLLALRNAAHAHHSGSHQSGHHGLHGGNHNIDDGASDISSDGGREVEPEGEETETAPEAEGEEDSVTRCICDFEHDDGYMICCDKCYVWQHVDCMGIDRMNIPDVYMCERCQPRRVDKMRARNIQLRKRDEFFNNETSSDTSSSSTDSEPLSVVNSAALKKRGPGPGGRRKNEPVGRKPVLVGLGGYRQRRDSSRDHIQSIPAPRRQPTPRKKSTENKRTPRRRKSKGAEDDKSPDPWEKSPPLQSLRQWIDNYEEAVTNHYSPELRARIQSIRVNGVHSELKVPSHLLSGSSPGIAKCRLTLLPNGTKILVTSCSLGANQPIIELRGKYMLSQQHRALSARNTPPPGPFLFFHRLPLPAIREATEVCVDCRTYGNDARFVRRSCKPNSEVRHCVEKGTLHLFLVTLCSVDKNTEITIRHQEGASLPCACGNPKECQAQSLLAAQAGASRRNGTQEEPIRRKRGRRRTVSSTYSRDLPSPSGRTPPSPGQHSLQSPTGGALSTPVTPASTPSTPPQSPVLDKRRKSSPPASPLSATKVKSEAKVKDEIKTEADEDDDTASDRDTKTEKVDKNIKVEKEERSPSPPPTPPTTRNTITRRSSTVNRQQAESDSTPRGRNRDKDKDKDKKEDEKPVRERRGKSESEQDQKNVAVKKESVDKNKNKTLTREERKMEAIMKAFERMEKQAQKKQEAQVRQQRQKSGDKTDEQEVSSSTQRKEINVERPRRRRRKGRGRSNSSSQQTKEQKQATTRSQRRTRLHSRGSDREIEPEPDPEDMSSDEEMVSPVQMHHDSINKTPPRALEKEIGSGGSCSSQGSTPPTPLSSACLLVAAAVGPLTPGFKFPKTKKGLLTSWFKTPDGGSATDPGKVTLSDMKPLSPEANMGSAMPSGPGGFAKKRWLRQAISEDQCDSPNSHVSAEYVAPPKKRRLARESMSGDSEAQQADSPANHESESDQPTQDEDTMDGTLPNLDNQDTETSSHDEGSQSAEDTDGPARNSHVMFDEHRLDMSTTLDPSLEMGAEADAEETEVEDEAELPPPRRLLHTPPVPVSDQVKLLPISSVSKGSSGEKLQNSPPDVPPSLTAPPPAEPPAAKRKLSISEYRQRKQRASTDTAANARADVLTPIAETDSSVNHKPSPRSRTSSTSSSSSLSSDDELINAPIMNKIRQLDMRAAAVAAAGGSAVVGATAGLSALDGSVLTKDGEAGDDKKGGSSWSSAPTLVERQRENLTQRLRREFGLFVDDEEAERARKQALLQSVGGLELSKEKDTNAPLLSKKTESFPPPPGPPPPTGLGSVVPLANPPASSQLNSKPVAPGSSSHGQLVPPNTPPRSNSSFYYPPFSRP